MFHDSCANHKFTIHLWSCQRRKQKRVARIQTRSENKERLTVACEHVTETYLITQQQKPKNMIKRTVACKHVTENIWSCHNKKLRKIVWQYIMNYCSLRTCHWNHLVMQQQKLKRKKENKERLPCNMSQKHYSMLTTKWSKRLWEWKQRMINGSMQTCHGKRLLISMAKTGKKFSKYKQTMTTLAWGHFVEKSVIFLINSFLLKHFINN